MQLMRPASWATRPTWSGPAVPRGSGSQPSGWLPIQESLRGVARLVRRGQRGEHESARLFLRKSFGAGSLLRLGRLFLLGRFFGRFLLAGLFFWLADLPLPAFCAAGASSAGFFLLARFGNRSLASGAISSMIERTRGEKGEAP